MKFPYGDSDFYRIIVEGYLYIDRTDRIRVIEEAGINLTWLRPRRFGKSLLLSMLENYYDLAKADRFDRLFGHLAIGQQPTVLHNQFFVLKWDFSRINPQGDLPLITRSLHDQINATIERFAVKYSPYLPQPITIQPDNSMASFASLLTAVATAGHPLYLFVDEYDNFANEVMMGNQDDSHDRYEALVTGEGLLKTIFKNIKASMDQGLGRVFITGVSPIVLSDVTSGYNISESLSLRQDLFDLCGFREDEVAPLVQQVVTACGLPATQADEALAIMRTFYNGSCFVYEAAPLLYNPTQIFYFLKYFQRECSYPRQLLDSNLAPDYQKLSYLSQRANGERLIADALSDQQAVTVVALADRFGLRQMLAETKSTTMLVSLLYYLGALTLAGETETGELILRIPNLTMRKLYVERLAELILPEDRMGVERLDIAKLLYAEGEMQPVCDFIAQHYFRVLDNRDYLQANELTVKIAFLTLLYNDTFYIMDSETALTRGYADLTMILRPEMRRYRLFDLVIEFKFIKLSELSLTQEKLAPLSDADLLALPVVQAELQSALTQVTGYYHKLATKYREPQRLRAYAVVAIGFDRLLWQQAVLT